MAKRVLPISLLLAAAIAASPALAERPDRPPGAGPHRMLAQQDGVSLAEAVEMVRRRYPGGRIVSAETHRSGNREVHVIKVLTKDGNVKTERIPGRSLRG